MYRTETTAATTADSPRFVSHSPSARRASPRSREELRELFFRRPAANESLARSAELSLPLHCESPRIRERRDPLGKIELG